MEACRRQQIVLAGPTRIERHFADALVDAERRVDARIVARLNNKMRARLDALLAEDVDGRVSRFIWLRQFEVGKSSADMNRQLGRLEFLQGIYLSPAILDDIPAHRIARLRRQGERYFTNGLRDITSDRRLAILATCVVEWSAVIADTVVETHDRIAGSIWRDAKRISYSRRYGDMKQALVPIETAQTMGLSMPLEPEVWIEDRKQRLEDGLYRLAMAVKNGALPSGVIEDGRLHVQRLETDVPAEADSLILDLYRRLPEVLITDILMDVDNDTRFTDDFTHLRTGALCKDRLGLLNVILAEGLNLGLSKMAGASSTHSFTRPNHPERAQIGVMSNNGRTREHLTVF